MSQTPEARPPLPLASKIGFGLWAIALLWWFAYYANYGGAFELLGLKFMCINGATDECLFFQKSIRTGIPTYHPIFWYAGMAALAYGFYQTWSARKPR